MGILWEDRGWDDYLYWQTQDKMTIKRINSLIKDAQRDPYNGIGKPEPLKGNQQGKWSRRITDEHRLIYSVSDGMVYVYVFSLRFHYKK